MSDESRLTPERIDEVERMAREAKARADDATQEPWTAVPSDDAPAGHSVVFPNGEDVSVLSDEDAEFIASARDDVPALACAALELAAEVRRLHAHFAVVEKEQEHDGKIASKLKGLLKQAKAEHDELRAEVERLRAIDAEWQRVTGYGAPERFPGLKRIDVEERARKATSDTRRPRDPAAIARLDAMFAAAPSEWQELFAELDRRDPKMSAEPSRAEGPPVGVDLGSEPATFAAARLVRQLDGEFRPLATFEGADAEQQARAFIATLPAEVAPAVDGRWLPGAEWEHRADHPTGPSRFTIDRLSSGESYAMFRGGDSELRANMTESNGWRYVGPADDGRWSPGAVWEYRGERRTIETATPGSDFVWLVGRGTNVTRRADMTADNGWRFIGRAWEEAVGKKGGAS